MCYVKWVCMCGKGVYVYVCGKRSVCACEGGVYVCVCVGCVCVWEGGCMCVGKRVCMCVKGVCMSVGRGVYVFV